MEKEITVQQAWEIVKQDLIQTIEKNADEDSDKSFHEHLGVEKPNEEKAALLFEALQGTETKSSAIAICLSDAEQLGTAILHVSAYAAVTVKERIEMELMLEKLKTLVRK